MDNDKKLELAKDAVRKKLLCVYESRGLQDSLAMSDKFLNEAAKTGKELDIQDFGKIIRGELSELYAEICLREYVNKHRNSFYVKSLCFKKSDGKDGYTELDLTLFTSSFVLVLECKSYSGEKTLTNEGCMNIKGRTSYNVFGQNRMHLSNLDPYIRNCRLKTVKDGGKPYILAMFSYSKDGIKDLRDEEWKRKFRLLTEENIAEYLDNINKNDKIWDVRKLFQIVSKMQESSEENKKKHIALLKQRRGES